MQWNTGSICEIRDCGPTAAGPTFTAATAFSDFIWADTNQAVNISLGGKLTVARNLTIRHTGGDILILRTTGLTANLVVSGNMSIEPNAICTLVSTSASFNVGMTVDIAGNFNQTGGTLNLTTSTNTSSTSPVGNGVLNVAGTFNLSGGTLNVCSSAATSTQANGTINVTGATNITGGTLNLNSSTTTGGGGLGVLNLSGNFVHTGGTISKTAAAAANTGTINIIGTGAQTIESTSGFAANTIAFNITQTTASGLCSILATKTFAVNSGTTVNINDNTSTGLATNPELTVLGNISVGGTGIINVNALAKLDMRTAAMTGTGTFNLATTATLLTQHAGGISTTAATGCIQTTTKTFHANANYYYNGTAAQVTGNALPTALTDTLTINNTSTITSSGVTLTQATSLSGNLRLINGRLITSSAVITISGSGTTSSGSIASFVDGPITRLFGSATTFVFPTGDVYLATGSVATAKWARIELASGIAGGNSYTAEYHKLDDPCNVNQALSNTNAVGINHVSYKEYWDMTRSLGTSTPVVKLYWEDNSESSSIGSAISSPIAADLCVAELITGTWNSKGTGTITTAGITGTVASGATATTFSTGVTFQFTFGAPTLVNPLPIELTTFTGYPTSDGNQLEWSTATETNNNYFDVERSADGAEFTKIASVNGNGNSTSTLNYNLLDPTPASGINYYRLKQVDFDGNSTYSNIISIEDETSENTVIQVYPNPSNDIVHIIASENIASFAIYNMLGELVFTSTSDQNNIQFNPISKGIYLIKAFTQDGNVSSTRFVRN
ncbi:MAG: T9SS type A sorting domain-containing protein [Bacteroidetes bacterium]|nr:T9SS type A sorting domain-containing protein [Bacteroidota bacterium]